MKRIYSFVFMSMLAVGALVAAGVGQAEAAQRNGRRGGAPSRGGDDSPLVARAQSVTGDAFRISISTPRGVRVYARTPPRPETLQAIDRGLSELFSIARRQGYRARLDHADYTIFIARADRTRNRNGAYSPDIALGAAQYAGSVYDQGGYVYAAGMVLAPEACTFIVAEHERDFQRVANVARYEGEHIVLYHNDPRRYQQTLDHSRGGGHPILQ
ncbi:MAG TPA: hypothetical protein VGB73_16705 [Pyrinomonadaceae bacterium]|jgi:hypothetical protein